MCKIKCTYCPVLPENQRFEGPDRDSGPLEQVATAKAKRKATARQGLIAGCIGYKTASPHDLALRAQAEFFVFAVCRPHTRAHMHTTTRKQSTVPGCSFILSLLAVNHGLRVVLCVCAMLAAQQHSLPKSMFDDPMWKAMMTAQFNAGYAHANTGAAEHPRRVPLLKRKARPSPCPRAAAHHRSRFILHSHRDFLTLFALLEH